MDATEALYELHALSTAHGITYEPDYRYPHLARAHCSCGWHMSGYATRAVADMQAHRHLTERSGRVA